VWTVGTVSPGGPQTLSIIATVDSPAAQTNTGTISDADQFDPNLVNNTASATETPPLIDVLWRHDGGQVYVWDMSGFGTTTEGAVALPVTSDWHVQGVGDFDADGNSDILWRSDGGSVYFWQMNGLQIKAEGAPVHAAVGNDWHVQGVGDFNGDGNSDVLWRQDGSGQVYVWEMNGQQVQAEGAVAHAPVTSDWHVESVNDFNGDGNSDVLWRQDGSGQVYVWQMNGQQVQAEGAVAHAPVTSDWHVFSDLNFI
jgi:hypothetical protein